MLAEGTDVEVYIKYRGNGPGGIAGVIHTVPTHPFDVDGWDGYLYPWSSMSRTSCRSPGRCISRRQCTGTVSGPEREQFGSLLELSWGGKETIELGDGATMTFLEDGMTVSIAATAPGPNGAVIDLGEVTGRIAPAIGS